MAVCKGMRLSVLCFVTTAALLEEVAAASWIGAKSAPTSELRKVLAATDTDGSQGRFEPMKSGGTKHLNWNTVEVLRPFYVKYADELTAVSRRIDVWCTRYKKSCISTGVEMEITYMRIRETKPRVVLEAAPNQGYSTTWLLSALNANGVGRLHSFDMADQPSAMESWTNHSSVTWHFHKGIIQDTFPATPTSVLDEVDYLFIDMNHHRDLTEWYTEHLFGYFAEHRSEERVIFVSVHDVFNHWYPLCKVPNHAVNGRLSKNTQLEDPTPEGLEVMLWIVRHASQVLNSFEWTKFRARGARMTQLAELREQTTGMPCNPGINGVLNMRHWCDVLTLWFEIHLTEGKK